MGGCPVNAGRPGQVRFATPGKVRRAEDRTSGLTSSRVSNATTPLPMQMPTRAAPAARSGCAPDFLQSSCGSPTRASALPRGPHLMRINAAAARSGRKFRVGIGCWPGIVVGPRRDRGLEAREPAEECKERARQASLTLAAVTQSARIYSWELADGQRVRNLGAEGRGRCQPSRSGARSRGERAGVGQHPCSRRRLAKPSALARRNPGAASCGRRPPSRRRQA